MEWLKHAFAIDDPKTIEPTDAQRALVDRLVQEVMHRGLATPTLVFLEMSRPLNFLGAQALHFFRPFLRVFTNSTAPRELAEFFEQRGSIEFVCRRLEELQRQTDRCDRSDSEKAVIESTQQPSDESGE